MKKTKKIVATLALVAILVCATVACQQEDDSNMLKILPKPLKITYKSGTAGSGYSETINASLPSEAYKLSINEQGVQIEASDKAGIFYAKKTLEQIKKQCYKLPCVEIEDKPKFSYRGFMLDCSRHFFDVETIKRQIDKMADIKLNVFHWHITDDQGWRIEIKKYPKLTEIGSCRGGNRACDNGFYTQEEIKDIVNYCSERNIEVIPEIDCPGHISSAIAAYPFLSCSEKQIPVPTKYGIHTNILCVGKDSVVEFWKNVLTEAASLFPSKYFHLGGDEAQKTEWKHCSNCAKRIKEENIAGVNELQTWFMNEMTAHMNKLGKTTIFWNDGISGGPLKGDYILQYWNTRKKYKEKTDIEIAKGTKFVYSPTDYFYLDYHPLITWPKKIYNYKDLIPATSYIGIEAPLWTEKIEDERQIIKRTYPRLYAVAERAWATDIDAKDFDKRLDFYRKNFPQ